MSICRCFKGCLIAMHYSGLAVTFSTAMRDLASCFFQANRATRIFGKMSGIQIDDVQATLDVWPQASCCHSGQAVSSSWKRSLRLLLSCLRAQPELCHRAPECVCGVSVSVRVSWVCLCACSLVLMQQRLLQWRMLRKRKQDKNAIPQTLLPWGCAGSLDELVLVV